EHLRVAHDQRIADRVVQHRVEDARPAPAVRVRLADADLRTLRGDALQLDRSRSVVLPPHAARARGLLAVPQERYQERRGAVTPGSVLVGVRDVVLEWPEPRLAPLSDALDEQRIRESRPRDLARDLRHRAE